MIVPKYWATGKMRLRDRSRQITVQRWGWSNESPAAAQAHADERARVALERVASGQERNRREPKVAYNGAEGVPIREEIIAEHGDTVITRNGYGALCLNTPNVLFADIDLEPSDTKPRNFLTGRTGLTLALFAPLAAAGVPLKTLLYGIVAGVIAAVVLGLLYRLTRRKDDYGDPRLRIDRPPTNPADHHAPAALKNAESAARARVAAFLQKHPDWRLRIYRTPAGFRLLALHRTFDPTEPAAREFFDAIGTDPIFVKMCARQRCFRARLSPKPWRIGITEHYCPRPAPVLANPRKDPKRWVQTYDAAAKGYAACQFVEDLGSAQVAPEAETVRRLHDELCQAHSNNPLA